MSTKTAHNQQAIEERTRSGQRFVPCADIFETKEALVLLLDMPGVGKGSVNVRLDDDRLEIEGLVDVGRYEGQEALYSEYNIGHYYRRFSVSNRIAKDKIEAKMNNGVLELTLPKIPEATPRRIAVG